MFFPGSDDTMTSPGHVGISVGNGMMIDAPFTGANVRYDSIAPGSFICSTFIAAGQVIRRSPVAVGG